MSDLGAVIAAQFGEWDLTMQGSLHLERSIYGTDDPEAIARSVDAFCRTELGAGIAEYLFYGSMQGSVSGVRLTDNRGVVIKIHPPSRSLAYLQALQRVQHHLAARDFPCPPLLLGPVPLGGGHAMVEALVDDGDYMDAHDPAIRRAMAIMLARLIGLTGELGMMPGMELGGLQRRLPHDLWPIPHSALFDFEATAAGAEWIDRIAGAAWQTLQESHSMPVIGHSDWSVKHFRFSDHVVRVIYDWDSLRLDSEASIVASAAVTFTYTEHLDVPRLPSADESRAFAAEYEAARGTPFTNAEWIAINAAATYSRAYGARCEHAISPQVTEFPPGSQRDALARYGTVDLRP